MYAATVVVDHQRQIGVGGGQIGPGLGHDVGVHLEGHVLGYLGRRLLLLGHKAVALLERLHLQRVHPVHNAVELLLQLGIAPDVDAARQHQVHGAIELLLGLGQSSLVIVGLAAGVGLLHLLNQQSHPLLLNGWAQAAREQAAGAARARAPGERGRGGLRRRARWSARGRSRVRSPPAKEPARRSREIDTESCQCA